MLPDEHKTDSYAVRVAAKNESIVKQLTYAVSVAC